MDLRKTVPDRRGSPLRHAYGAPGGVASSNPVPYDQSQIPGQDSIAFSHSREGSFAVNQGGPPRLYSGERALDERHEELKRQIAMKEQLLNEMTHERESGRRLRYLNRSQSGSRSKLNMQKVPDSQFRIETRAQKQLSKSNDRVTDSQFIGMRSTNFTGYPTRNTQPVSTITGQVGSEVQAASPQQLQFHPSKMQTYNGGLNRSPLRETRGAMSASQHSQSPARNQSPPRQVFGQSRFAQSFNARNSPLRESPIMTRTVRIESGPIIEPPHVPVPAPIATGSFDVRHRLYQERVESMTMDNAALQRRLHQLQADLAETKREVDSMLGRLRLVEGSNQNMDHTVSAKDDIDVTNQMMQQDLDRMRHTNALMQEDLSKHQTANSSTVRNLDNATFARQNLESQSSQLMSDLQRKLDAMRHLNAEIENLFSKSNMAQVELESLNREDHVHNQHIGDLSQGIQRMQVERDDIAQRVSQITRQLDQVLNSNETDRHQLELKRRWQTKLVTSKIMQQVLETLMKTRIASAFNEVKDYSAFDKVCHLKLKALGKALNRIGLRKQAKCLHKWYDTCLKPLAFREQNSDIALMIECNRLQSKVFHAWVNQIHARKNADNMKYHGVDQILAIFKRNQRQQVKRVIDIWKEGIQSNDTRYLIIKKCIRRINERSLRRVWTTWFGYNSLIEQDVRCHILKLTFTQKIHLSNTFHQLRQATLTEKRMRLRRLRLVMKGWRKYAAYSRQLMLVNMSAIQFVKGNQSALTKAIFDELRRNKESRKFKLLHHAVTEDMDPNIEGLEQYNDHKQNAILNADKMRACAAVKDCLAKRLYSFFRKWTKESGHYQISLKSQVANRIIKNYNNNLIWGLQRWKNQMLLRDTQLNYRINQQLYMNVDQQSTKADQNETYLRGKEELHRTAKRIIIDKTLRKLCYRSQSVAIGRWKDICNLRTDQEQNFARIILRNRKRNLRTAFDRYIEFLKWSRQHYKNLAGADSLFYKIKLKEMQKTFNAMCWFTNRNKRARRYWHKILSRMDGYIKKRHMTIWRFHAGVKFEFELDQNQNSVTDSIYRRNQLICSMEKHDAEQEDFISYDAKLRRNKAYRQLGNYFVRTQMSRSYEYFRKWRETIQQEKHKQHIIRKTMDHYKRHSFDICARAFMKMVNRDRQAEFQRELRQRRLEQNDIEHARKIEMATHDSYKAKYHMTAQEIQDSISLRVNTQSKLMHIVERRSKEWLFISKKRQVFNALKHAGKTHNAFCLRVGKILERTLLYKGLFNIKAAAEQSDFTSKVQKRLKMFGLRYTRNNQLDAFNRWKMYSLSLVDERQKESSRIMEGRIDEFNEYMKQVKKVNMARCFAFLQEKNLSNLFTGLKNAVKLTKQLRIKEEEFKARQQYRQRKNAVERWNLRTVETLKCRHQVKSLKQKLEYQLMKRCFNGLAGRNNIQNQLTNNLGNLEKLMRNKIYYDSFHNIRAYGLTKDTYNDKRKRHALRRMLDLCRNQYSTDTRYAFNHYKIQVKVTVNKGYREFSTILRKYANKGLRASFTKWKAKDEKLRLVWANYDVGPCRVDFWEANREIENLREFMRAERFSENAIDTMCRKAHNQNQHLMNKFLIRMKLKPSVSGKSPYLPYFFDRWKQYIALRKIFRETFRECWNRTNNVRADLQAAFNMWKYKPTTLRKNLNRLSTKQLTEIGLMTTKKVGNCAEHLYENQSVANHLMIQRDEFLNYYIKSQVLAMALLKDRAKSSQMEVWNRWFNRRRRINKQELLREIRDASYLLSNLEARKKQLEERNTVLKTENVSMTSLTTDQKVVYKNKDQLARAMLVLKSDISETDTDYEALLRENQRLKREIASVEGIDEKPQNRRYGELWRITKPKDSKEIENEPNLFTQSVKVPKDETASDKKQREQQERFQRLAAKAGSGIR